MLREFSRSISTRNSQFPGEDLGRGDKVVAPRKEERHGSLSEPEGQQPQ